MNEIHETQLITEMVSNGLLQVPNKKLQQKICQLCYFLKLANSNLFLWRHLEISSVLLLNKASGSAQIMESFSDKHRSQRFEPHCYGEAFLWILLSLIHAFTVSETFCMVVVPWFELPFRSSIVNKAVGRCCRCSFVY